MDYAEALAQATELGYAEADPTADIEGLDAGRKVAILASVAFNSRVVFNDVYTEGIAKITSKDIHYAKEMGRDIKLLGVARNEADGIEAYVCPMLIPSSHPLATVMIPIMQYLSMEMQWRMPCSSEEEQENFLQPVQLWVMYLIL